jgi:hypothetical protein
LSIAGGRYIWRFEINILTQENRFRFYRYLCGQIQENRQRKHSQ